MFQNRWISVRYRISLILVRRFISEAPLVSLANSLILESYLRERFQLRLHGNFTSAETSTVTKARSCKVKKSSRNPDGMFHHFPTILPCTIHQ